jgi:hypothetical protein
MGPGKRPCLGYGYSDHGKWLPVGLDMPAGQLGDSVDWSKWNRRAVCEPEMSGANDNVELITVSGGVVNIHGTWDNSICSNQVPFPSQALDTLRPYGPGYFEARMQEPPAGSGTHGAFWTLGGNGDCVDQMPVGFEGDIDEFFNGAGTGAWHIHWGGYGSCHQAIGAALNEPPTGFHIYGMLYDAVNGASFFMDGAPVPNGHVNEGCSASTPCTVPLIMEVGETGGSANTPPFQVDWVRHYVAH